MKNQKKKWSWYKSYLASYQSITDSAMILLLFSVAAAIYYVPWILKMIGDWIHQYPLVKKLPGPKGLPIIGSLLDVAGDTTGELCCLHSEGRSGKLSRTFYVHLSDGTNKY